MQKIKRRYFTLDVPKEFIGEDFNLREIALKLLLDCLSKDNEYTSIYSYKESAMQDMLSRIYRQEKDTKDRAYRKKQYEPSIHLLCETNIDMTINVKTKTILEHIEKNQYDINTLIISKGFFDKRIKYDKDELRKPKVEEMIINEYNNRCYDYYNDYTKLHVVTR